MKKILVVDDDPDILEAVETVLSMGGYTSSALTNGDEVYRKVMQDNPHLIILDVLLSGSDGRVICKSLKQDQKTKDIPIIMISAHPSAQKSVEESGADSFIPKPFSIQSLLSEVEKLLK